MMTAIIAIIVLIIVLVFFTFVLFLLLHGEHRQLLPVKLAASTILSQVPLALFNQPGAILSILDEEGITHQQPFRNDSYCWMNECIGTFTAMVIPLTLMMFTIERLMYIRNPTGHAQKITRAGAITLVVFPWVISFALIIMYVVVLLTGSAMEDIDFCGSQTNSHMYQTMNMILEHIIGGVIPMLINSVVTICVLVMWCCFKCKMSRGMDYSVMGEEVEATVRNSVIAVAVLNGLFVPICIFEIGIGSITRLEFGFLTLFGVIEGIMWICTIIPVRKKFVALFTCCRRESEQLSVQYSVTNTEKVTETKPV